MGKNDQVSERAASWVSFFAESEGVPAADVAVADITKKSKLAVGAVEKNKVVLVYTDAGSDDVFRRLSKAGYGAREVCCAAGSEPSGEVIKKTVDDLMGNSLRSGTGVLVINPFAAGSKGGFKDSWHTFLEVSSLDQC